MGKSFKVILRYLSITFLITVFDHLGTLNLKVHVSFAITSAVEGFYPKNVAGNTSYHFESFSHALPLITLLASMASSSFGMTKFFVSGPIPIFPIERKFDGILSFPFLCVLILNTMFGCRLLCIEGAFFTYYRLQSYGVEGLQNKYVDDKSIDPLIPPKYRIAVYLIPSLISCIINALRFLCTGKDLKHIVRKYPQIMIACLFTPFMYEGCKDNNIRVWKYGSLFNAFFIGCFPQIVLLVMDFYRGIVDWDFLGTVLNYEQIHENNDALIKYNYGNSIFAIISLSFYLLLILLTFFTTKVIIDHEKFFRFGVSLPLSSQTQFSNTKTKISISQCLPDQTVIVPKENEVIDETPYCSTQLKSTEKHNITMRDNFNRKIDSNKKTLEVEGNVKLIKVMTYYDMHIF